MKAWGRRFAAWKWVDDVDGNSQHKACKGELLPNTARCRSLVKYCIYIYINIYIYMYVCMYVCMYVWLCMNIDLGGALRKNGESQLPGTRSILRVAQLVAIYRTRRAPQPRQAAPCLSPAVAFPRHLLCSAIMPNWMTWPQTHSWWQKHEGVAWITWRVLFNTIK